MARGGVSFELERFGWTGGDAVLEVAGRWRGPRSRRFGPATLAVDAGGRRRLALGFTTGDVRADPEPMLWRAEYRWDEGAVGGFELEVGSSLVIELPAPEGAAPPAERTGREATAPALGELEAAHRQIEADRLEKERLRDEIVDLRRDGHERSETLALLAQAEAAVEAERTVVRAQREAAASRRAAELEEAGRPGSPAQRAREEISALRLAVEQGREEAAAALREAERAREELLKVRAGAGAAGVASRQREHSLEQERAAALEEVRRLEERLAAAAAPREPVATPAEPEPASTPPPPPPEPPEAPDPEPPTSEFDQIEPTETLVLEGPRPRRRPPVHQFRPRVIVVPQRTESAPRRFAERPPADSPALRAIAVVLLVLLAIVLIAVLVIVA